MTPRQFLDAARVPRTLKPQTFGLWTIERLKDTQTPLAYMGWLGYPDYTLLRRVSLRTMHLENSSEIVMEDSRRELSKHLPIWLAAHGRVLVTGLGLGCVVRGLLASSAVEHIDVVEIDPGIIRVVGAEFADNPRVTIHQGDALSVEFPTVQRWDFAWHDLWTDGPDHLQVLHSQLFLRFRDRTGQQGAWAFPRHVARLFPWRPLGAPRP